MTVTIKPGLPDIPHGLDPRLTQFLKALKESTEIARGHRGNDLDRYVSLRELIDSGIAKKARAGGGLAIGDGITDMMPGPIDDGTDVIGGDTPPTPTGLDADGALQNVILEWDPHNFGNFAYTEIWRASVDDLGQAVRIGTTQALVYADPVGVSSQTLYYWIRHVSTSNKKSQFNALGGFEVATAQTDTEELANLAVDTTQIVNAAITTAKIADFAVESAKIKDAAIIAAKIANLAVGTAAIQDGAIVNAKIGNLAVDSAKIASAAIVEAKIGTAAVTNAKIGQFIQSDNYVFGVSGFHINKNGFMELRDLYARGDIEASLLKADAANIVNTLHVAGNAITVPVSAYTSGSIDIDVGWVTIQQVTITTSGGLVLIMSSFNISLAATFNDECTADLRILRDATEIMFIEDAARLEGPGISGGVSFGTQTVTPLITDNPGSGTFTYYLQAAETGD